MHRFQMLPCPDRAIRGTDFVALRGMGDFMNQKYDSQMKKGVLDMLVLKLLEKEAKYGYQIIQEMKE